MILSAVIGEATDRSRALVVAVTLHGWIDALGEAPEVLGIPPVRVYAVRRVAGILGVDAVEVAKEDDVLTNDIRTEIRLRRLLCSL
jgi:hypothetical protein